MNWDVIIQGGAIIALLFILGWAVTGVQRAQ